MDLSITWSSKLQNFRQLQLWCRATRCASTETPTLLHLVHYTSGDCMPVRSNQTNQFPAKTGVTTMTTKIYSMFQVLLAELRVVRLQKHPRYYIWCITRLATVCQCALIKRTNFPQRQESPRSQLKYIPCFRFSLRQDHFWQLDQSGRAVWADEEPSCSKQAQVLS